MSDEGVNSFAEQDWPLEPCAGDTHTDDQGRLWTCFVIGHGARGGRWAYYQVVGRFGDCFPKLAVLIDTRQHLQAAHFAGMLAIPWDGLSKLGWVLGKQWCQPVAEKLEPLPSEGVRFERLEKPPED